MREHNLDRQNDTRVLYFILLGFPGSQYLQQFIFTLFLVMYILAVLGNVTIFILVIANQRLHIPMYFFLCNLSFLEIWYTTASIPKALAIILGRSRNISFTGCILQMYFVFALGLTEYFLLSAMAYDRYLAICYPLHYSTIMDLSLSGKLALSSWLCGFLVICIPAFLITRLSFCGPNVINHFYCSIDSWIVLSCTDTYAIEMAAFVISFVVILGSCLITFLSYIYIISTILHIPSTKGQQKAFSTCSSHLAVVMIWYSATIFLFVKPSKRTSSEMTKIVNILSTIVTPLLNPFIYTLRNKDVKKSFPKLVKSLEITFQGSIWSCGNGIPTAEDGKDAGFQVPHSSVVAKPGSGHNHATRLASKWPAADAINKPEPTRHRFPEQTSAASSPEDLEDHCSLTSWHTLLQRRPSGAEEHVPRNLGGMNRRMSAIDARWAQGRECGKAPARRQPVKTQAAASSSVFITKSRLPKHSWKPCRLGLEMGEA
ncbi:olfactory receptor 6F1-like [Sphaerodactylus townsendi]|uniref:olfactory receptor 6F1-like n=1 Tax=Sphaerodactylus townsendi TaxID=933632 RepID=UPI002025F8AB|nr:olfactory receptor 6F1-like [Sphaerodactylus townsendi]